MPRVNPIFPGTVTARKYANHGGSLSNTATRVLNGTTAVNIFGSTNGVSGTAYVFRVHSGSTEAGTIQLEIAGAVVATVTRGTNQTITQANLGSLAFTAGGTMGARSSLASDTSVVELVFK